MKLNLLQYQQQKLEANIRMWLIIFIVALVISGLTALGIETQMRIFSPLFPDRHTVAGGWLWKVYYAIKDTNQRYPFLAYGFDWLAFAHLVIATAFIGPLQDPVRNIWVIRFGRIACCMVPPFALIASLYRGLPAWWILIDCSFGIIGFIPLTICLKRIKQLAQLQQIKPSNQPVSSIKNQPYPYESANLNA